MKNIIYFVWVIVILGCSNSNTNTDSVKRDFPGKESWMNDDRSQWPQVLLTNFFAFKDRPLGMGASSFLIVVENDTMLCTARHLLGEDMGIIPEVSADSVNDLLISWKAFPRINRICSDTIEAVKLLSEDGNDKDIILFKIRHDATKIKPLRPRYDKPVPGEQLFIIGCEYSQDCHQQVYEVVMNSFEDGKIYIISKEKFEIRGFSGAPVVDRNGFVVGVISLGGEYENKLFVGLEPIESIRSWIK